jgi:hypothetical protein
MSVHTRSTQRHIPEDGILHRHRRENLKSYKFPLCFICQETINTSIFLRRRIFMFTIIAPVKSFDTKLLGNQDPPAYEIWASLLVAVKEKLRSAMNNLSELHILKDILQHQISLRCIISLTTIFLRNTLCPLITRFLRQNSAYVYIPCFPFELPAKRVKSSHLTLSAHLYKSRTFAL